MICSNRLPVILQSWPTGSFLDITGVEGQSVESQGVGGHVVEGYVVGSQGFEGQGDLGGLVVRI
jgi:hypothetical protein